MQIPFSVRLRSLFARNKEQFWWNHFTDEERELREMDVMQLAAALNEALVRRNDQRRIVIEHMLGARLARLQAKAAWGAGALGFAGAVLGAGITAAVAAALTPIQEPKIEVTCTCPEAQSPRAPLPAPQALPASSPVSSSAPTTSKK